MVQKRNIVNGAAAKGANIYTAPSAVDSVHILNVTLPPMHTCRQLINSEKIITYSSVAALFMAKHILRFKFNVKTVKIIMIILLP